MSAPEMLTAQEACAALACSEVQLEELLRTGVLPGNKFGRPWIMHRAKFFERVGEICVNTALARAQSSRLSLVPSSAPVALTPEKTKPGRPRLR